MSVYIDTSVLVTLLVDEPFSPSARSWLKRTSDTTIVGDLARLELAAVVSRGLRTGRVDTVRANAMLTDLDELLTQWDPYCHTTDDFLLADQIIRDFATKLAAPDALHLASAWRLGAKLATFDLRLMDAARIRGVEIEIVS